MHAEHFPPNNKKNEYSSGSTNSPLRAGIIIGCKPAKSDVEERVKRRERKTGAPLVAG